MYGPIPVCALRQSGEPRPARPQGSTQLTAPELLADLPSQGYDGLGQLAELGRSAVAKLVAALAAEELTLDFRALSERLAPAVGCNAAAAETMLWALTWLNQLRRSRGLEAVAFLLALRRSLQLEAPPDWWPRHEPGWDAIAADLEPLFADGSFASKAAKALGLLQDRPGLLLDFKLRTDLRPLLDEEASRVEALLLTNALVIEYQTEGEERVLHLSLDADDLDRIAEQLERLRKKNAAVSKLAREQWRLPLVGLSHAED